MKKFLVLGIVALFSGNISAQKIDAASVPAPVKTAFEKTFPGASNPKWEKEKGSYEAGFKQNGKTMSALFHADGTMTESELSIKIADLPANVQAYVKEHYKGKAVKEAAKITKGNGEINYEAEVAGKDIIFDARGQFLREEVE